MIVLQPFTRRLQLHTPTLLADWQATRNHRSCEENQAQWRWIATSKLMRQHLFIVLANLPFN